MECESIEGVEEERVTAINQDEYNEGLALSILPEGYNYHFQSIDVISEWRNANCDCWKNQCENSK
jgi:hypothetical protein